MFLVSPNSKTARVKKQRPQRLLIILVVGGDDAMGVCRSKKWWRLDLCRRGTMMLAWKTRRWKCEGDGAF
jgi:hypothetical protein